jgi:hypothetical protein
MLKCPVLARRARPVLIAGSVIGQRPVATVMPDTSGPAEKLALVVALVTLLESWVATVVSAARRFVSSDRIAVAFQFIERRAAGLDFAAAMPLVIAAAPNNVCLDPSTPWTCRGPGLRWSRVRERDHAEGGQE